MGSITRNLRCMVDGRVVPGGTWEARLAIADRHGKFICPAPTLFSSACNTLPQPPHGLKRHLERLWRWSSCPRQGARSSGAYPREHGRFSHTAPAAARSASRAAVGIEGRPPERRSERLGSVGSASRAAP